MEPAGTVTQKPNWIDSFTGTASGNHEVLAGQVLAELQVLAGQVLAELQVLGGQVLVRLLLTGLVLARFALVLDSVYHLCPATI